MGVVVGILISVFAFTGPTNISSIETEVMFLSSNDPVITLQFQASDGVNTQVILIIPMALTLSGQHSKIFIVVGMVDIHLWITMVISYYVHYCVFSLIHPF